MSLGKRKHEQQEAWVATTDLPKSPGHPFYRRLNQILAEAGFDAWLEQLCQPYYADQQGRPSIAPGTYFRMILIGYFEGLASQRGIAWRCFKLLGYYRGRHGRGGLWPGFPRAWLASGSLPPDCCDVRRTRRWLAGVGGRW